MAARELPSGTVTLLFTDIEGSTRMLQELGREAYVRALTEHRRLLREAFTAHGGVEVEMQGDSFHFAFPFARDAVAAAVAGQRALSGYRWESQPIKVRIGLHTGEPMQAEGLYAGLDVHWAARVMSSGHGGQILLSHRTAELVTGELPEEISLRDLGEHRLKDLTAPQRLHQVGDTDFPSLKTLPRQASLPIAASPLIGRGRELAELTKLLRNGARLVTVTGTGGTGKTRLALQAAAELVGDFSDGVFWVPLAGLQDPSLVLASVAQILGAREELALFLAARETLLVLDNFEHVIAASAPLAELLAATPGVKALVTSRAPLHVDGEHEFSLDPLAPNEAKTLFVERARAAGRELEVDANVAEICRRLDNLPLALELAAARTKLLAPQALLGRLEQRLPLLTGGRRDAPERQRTLRATIEWSYELLDVDAKELFARLSIFGGSFSFDAAEQICDADLGGLDALVDLSLLKPIGDDRFLMLETIREFAYFQLEAAGEADAWRERHASHYLELAERLAPALRGGHQRSRSLYLLAAEFDNLGTALRWFDGIPSDARLLRLAVAVWRFWMARGYLALGRSWLDRGLRSAEPLPEVLRARALEGCFLFAFTQGDAGQARQLASEVLTLYQALADARGIADTVCHLGLMAAAEGDVEEAEALFGESVALAEKSGDRLLVAVASANLGEVARRKGEYERAVKLATEAAALSEDLGDPGLAAVIAVGEGEALRELGRADDAELAFRRCLAAVDALSQRDAAVLALLGLADLAAAAGRIERGTRLAGAADALLEAIGSSWTVILEHDQQRRERLHELLIDRLGAEGFAAAYAQGRNLSLPDAVAFALEADVGAVRIP